MLFYMDRQNIYLISNMIILLEKAWRILRAHLLEGKPLPTNMEVLIAEIKKNYQELLPESDRIEKYVKQTLKEQNQTK